MNLRPKQFVRLLSKPCYELSFCPYGPLVEHMPLREEEDRDQKSCTVFGHDCPVFSCAECITEEVMDADEGDERLITSNVNKKASPLPRVADGGRPGLRPVLVPDEPTEV